MSSMMIQLVSVCTTMSTYHLLLDVFSPQHLNFLHTDHGNVTMSWAKAVPTPRGDLSFISPVPQPLTKLMKLGSSPKTCANTEGMWKSCASISVFHQTSFQFLGCCIRPEVVQMNTGKVQAILNRPLPPTIKEIHCFLGFANFY